MQFSLAGRRVCVLRWEGPDQWMELYWMHSTWHKTNSPSMTTQSEWAKGETHSFFFTLLPQLPTLLAGPSVTELFILCPTLPFLSDTHYAHGSFILAHKPTKTCYITVSELQWKKQNNNTTQSGHRSPALVCTGTVFHGKAPRITRMRPKLRHMQEIRAGKSWLSHIICTHVRKERKNQKALYRAFPCLHE